jgi:hypothetical protein
MEIQRASPLSFLILITLELLSTPHARASDSYACLRYEPVSLTGTMVRHTYPGPPDYESFSKDRPQTIWVLLLDRSICVDDSDPTYPRVYHEREVQLLVSMEQYQSYKTLLGKKVIATGELMHGGARHDKRLVLVVDEMSRAPSR